MAPTPTYPLEDDIATIDAAIAKLEREAEQAQSSRAEATSEVASTQKAIRELKTARAQILEREALWERSASQLQSALAERKRVADQVRKALATDGSLAQQRKTDLETALKAKAGIPHSPDLNRLYQAVDGIDAASALVDNTARNAWQTAATSLATAERLYAERAAAAEAAWEAIFNGARNLDEQLQTAQELLAEATSLTEATREPPTGTLINDAAAEAVLAWKDFADAYQQLIDNTGPAGEQNLVAAWNTARPAVQNALAEVLVCRQALAEALRQHELRQAPRPGRSTSEHDAAIAAICNCPR